MSWIFRVCPQWNAMTLHLTGPESHVFPMTFFFRTLEFYRVRVFE